MRVLKYAWQTRRLGWVMGASVLAMLAVVLVGDGGFQVNWDTLYEPKYVLYMELLFILLSTVVAVLIEPSSAQWEGDSSRARTVALFSLFVSFVGIWLVAAVAMGTLLRIYPANAVVFMVFTTSTLVASVTLGLSPCIGPYWAGASSLGVYAACVAIQGFIPAYRSLVPLGDSRLMPSPTEPQVILATVIALVLCVLSHWRSGGLRRGRRIVKEDLS